MDTVQTKKDSGFTLVELVVVMGIIGILAAVAIPALSNLTKDALASSQQQYIDTARAALDSARQDSAPNTYASLTEIASYIEDMAPTPVVKATNASTDDVAAIQKEIDGVFYGITFFQWNSTNGICENGVDTIADNGQQYEPVATLVTKDEKACQVATKVAMDANDETARDTTAGTDTTNADGNDDPLITLIRIGETAATEAPNT